MEGYTPMSSLSKNVLDFHLEEERQKHSKLSNEQSKLLKGKKQRNTLGWSVERPV